MGKLRDLTADEILAQMFYAQKLQRLEELPEISNVVFMGMGKCAWNYHIQSFVIMRSDYVQ
jgi:adenine C2-methylase RlmN of 23S rRNA A2503 and tRNA A37